MKSENPTIEWYKKSGEQCLKFTFQEKLTEREAAIAIDEWREAFESKPGEKITLIWECNKMQGYETGARAKWTEALKELKSQIGPIWLISDSTFIRMGASVMAMFSSLNIKPVVSENEIQI